MVEGGSTLQYQKKGNQMSRNYCLAVVSMAKLRMLCCGRQAWSLVRPGQPHSVRDCVRVPCGPAVWVCVAHGMLQPPCWAAQLAVEQLQLLINWSVGWPIVACSAAN